MADADIAAPAGPKVRFNVDLNDQDEADEYAPAAPSPASAAEPITPPGDTQSEHIRNLLREFAELITVPPGEYCAPSCVYGVPNFPYVGIFTSDLLGSGPFRALRCT